MPGKLISADALVIMKTVVALHQVVTSQLMPYGTYGAQGLVAN